MAKKVVDPVISQPTLPFTQVTTGEALSEISAQIESAEAVLMVLNRAHSSLLDMDATAVFELNFRDRIDFYRSISITLKL